MKKILCLSLLAVSGIFAQAPVKKDIHKDADHKDAHHKAHKDEMKKDVSMNKEEMKK